MNIFSRIRSYLSILRLVAILTHSFKQGLKLVLFKEEREPDYLAQKDFKTCSDRSMAIMLEAVTKPVKMLSYAICQHREKFHGEGHLREKVELSNDLTPKEIKISSRGFWLG